MSTKFKTLYQFSIPKTVEVDETTETAGENGEVIKVTKKVKKTAPQTFCLKKPNSAMTNEADLFYHKSVMEGVRAGLMSTAYLAKTVGKDDGNLSEDERSGARDLLKEWASKEAELGKIEESLKAGETEELKSQQADLEKQIAAIRKEVQFLELRQSNLFESSAEARARKRLLAWWMLSLPHKQDGNDWKPLFEGEDLIAKEDSYDNFEESFVTEDERLFFGELIKEIGFSVSLWFNGQANKQEDFDKIKAERAANEQPASE